MKRHSLALMAGALLAATAGSFGFAPEIRAVLPPPQRSVKIRRVRLTASGSGRLNRSRHWRFARTYKEARTMSPFPNRPVR